MMRLPNYRILVAGWPTEAVLATGACIGYFQYKLSKGYYLISKKDHLNKILETLNLPTHGEMELVPTFKEAA